MSLHPVIGGVQPVEPFKRWKVVIRYWPENYEDKMFFIEELYELHDKIEYDVDFTLIKKIEVCYYGGKSCAQ